MVVAGWRVSEQREHNNSVPDGRGVPEGRREKPPPRRAARESDEHAQLLVLWQQMLRHLREHHAPTCRPWFDELVPLKISGGTLEVRAGSTVHRDYLRETCGSAFNDAARSVTNTLLAVRFVAPAVVVEPRTPADLVRGVALRNTRFDPADPASPRHDTLLIDPDNTFESFIVGPNSMLAHAAAQSVAETPGKSYNPLFIHGGVGLGKTHILQAICLRIIAHSPDVVFFYTSCEGFISGYFDSVKAGKIEEFRQRYRGVDVLVIDDIHALAKLEQSQEEFFNTFNALHQSGRQIILSSDTPPEQIPGLQDRLTSRFKSGLVAKLDPPDFETRIQIVKAKGRVRGLEIPTDVAEAIAGSARDNVRELQGAVNRLHIQLSIDKQPLTLEFAQRTLSDIVRVASAEPTVQDVIQVVIDHFQVKMTDLQGKSRTHSVALPRHVCMFLARKCTRLSLEEIGGFFGGRDHTTVLNAVRTIEARMAENHDFAMKIKSLEDRAMKTSKSFAATPAG
jgi:chromosomal replication initiator protein